MQLLAGAERAEMLTMLEGYCRPQLEAQGMVSHAQHVASATLVRMESILFEHLRNCPQCAPLVSSIRTVEAFSAAWNSLSREPVPAGHLWMPESDVVIRSAAQPAGMSAEEITVLIERAVKAATVAHRKTTITKGADGELVAETVAT
jgi:hypothetical protein